MSLKTMRSAMAVLEKILAVLVAAMVVLVFANVLTRYVFHVSIAWSEEVARFLFVFVVAIGSVIALARDEHLNIQFYEYFNSPRLTRFFKTVSMILTALALGVLVYGGTELVQIGMRHPAPVTGIPLGFVTLVVVVSMAAMLAIAIYKIYQIIDKGQK